MSNMSTARALPELIAHGQHVRPAYEDAAAGQSTPDDRPEAAVHGTLARFEKQQSASATAQAYGWIKALYPDAIEYAGQKQALEGMIMVAAFMFLPGALIGFGMMLFAAQFLWRDSALVSMVILAGCLGMLAFAYWITLFPLRHVWRTPRDLPIIFDRANRKIYRMAQLREPGLRGLIKPWPVKALCYDWDLVDAEHHSELIGSANVARRVHRLLFVVRQSADDPTIIDSFGVGNGLAQGEEMVAPMYEHIRRFMQAGGPHLPHPAEPLDERGDDIPTWWQACGRAGPWGSRYLYWWKAHWGMAAMHHFVLFVGLMPAIGGFLASQSSAPLVMLGLSWISLAMVWGQGTGIWLMAHTSYLLDWPRAVHEAIGQATRKGTGW